MVSSRLYNKDIHGPEYDHLSIIVELNERWLVDVAHGDLFIEPLRIDSVGVQEGEFKLHKIEQLSDKKYLLWESQKGIVEFKKKYTFDLSPKAIDQFSDQSIYKQTSPDSHFVKNIICTKPTQLGRKTIFNKVYKVESACHVEEISITDNDTLLSILKEEFNIIIPNAEKAII